MSKRLTIKEGIALTKFARQTIESQFHDSNQLAPSEASSEAFQEPRGVFVTLKKHDSRDKSKWHLRGCIGHLQQGPRNQQKTLSLLEATRQAALSSAFEDPRFPPVRVDELKTILVEISVLTLPEEIFAKTASKLIEQITIGKDGLIVQGKGWQRGLLLPQVAPEQGWDAEAFLEGCCRKAGLPPKCYLESDVTILKFQAQIFSEVKPKGKIVEREF